MSTCGVAGPWRWGAGGLQFPAAQPQHSRTEQGPGGQGQLPAAPEAAGAQTVRVGRTWPSALTPADGRGQLASGRGRQLPRAAAPKQTAAGHPAHDRRGLTPGKQGDVAPGCPGEARASVTMARIRGPPVTAATALCGPSVWKGRSLYCIPPATRHNLGRLFAQHFFFRENGVAYV